MNKQLKEIIEIYTSLGYSTEETLQHITTITNEMLGNEVDMANLVKPAQIFIDIEKTYIPENSEAWNKAKDDLYEMYEIDFTPEERILENTIDELSKYDKLIDYDGQTLPFLLHQLIIILEIYGNLLITWGKQKKLDSLNRTIAHTSSTTAEKMLSPLNPYMRDSAYTNAMQTKVLRNICEDFKEDAYALDYALSTIKHLVPKDFKKIDKDKVDALFSSMEFINSNGRVDVKDIYTSLKIQIARLYLKNSDFQIMLKLDKHISKEKLVMHIDVIMEHLFDVSSSTKANQLGRPIQVRTHYEGVPLLEYTRKGKEKLHPMLEDTEFLNEILEKIKGNIPSKQSS